MKASIKHDLTPEQLRAAVRKFADVYVQKYQEYKAETAWLSDDEIEVRFNVKGVKLAGQLHLQPDDILLEMNVPLPLRLFQSRAVKTIEDTVRPWLEKAKRGELEA
ncbi:MAG: polyhydroxyalkanoic acid system family protein [Polyangiales bacterium]